MFFTVQIVGWVFACLFVWLFSWLITKHMSEIRRGRIYLVTTHGIIGGGKSTFLDRLKIAFEAMGIGAVVATEPVDEWVALIDNQPGTSLLDEMYRAQARIRRKQAESKAKSPSPFGIESDEERSMSDSTQALPAPATVANSNDDEDDEVFDGVCGAFQLNAFVSRTRRIVLARRKAKELLRANPERDVLVIIERSIYDDKYIFKAMGVEDGYIDPFQSRVYDSVFEAWEDICQKFTADLAVYVDTSVDSAMARIAKRGRAAELGIPREYQQKLKDRHDKFLAAPHTHYVGAPIMRIDGERPFHECHKEIGAIAGEIVEHLGLVPAK